ncbi:MAG: COG4223 family protein, partial [Pseudodonghicola sp.]
ARAAEAAQLAANRTALAELRAALDSGAGYENLLTELRSGGVTIPDALAATAKDGVVTLAALRDGFAPAARDALAAARAQAKGTDRSLTAFLQRQLGARSVAPREGADPDAILSRAEAALTAGNLSAALTEVDSLPEAARAALADWSALAHLRANAIAAADTLAQSLNTN